MTKDGVTSEVIDAKIVYTANTDMINVGTYTITATVDDKYTATATYKITTGNINVEFPTEFKKGTSVADVKATFNDITSTDAKSFVEVKLYKITKEKYGFVITKEEVTEITESGKYYFVVTKKDELSINYTINGTALGLGISLESEKQTVTVE